MGDANELNETNYTCTITNIFSKLYLASELRSHEEVNQKNFKATEDKIQPLYQDLNEYATGTLFLLIFAFVTLLLR